MMKLEACNGSPPNPVSLDSNTTIERYMTHILVDCARQMYGMLDGWRVPKAEQWLPLDQHGETNINVVRLPKEDAAQSEESNESKTRKRSLDNFIVVVVDARSKEYNLAVLHHNRRGDRVEVIGTTADLECVLGKTHFVVRRLEESINYADKNAASKFVACIDYGGDLVNAIMHSKLIDSIDEREALLCRHRSAQAARNAYRSARSGSSYLSLDQDEDKPEDIIAYDKRFLKALATGTRHALSWPSLDPEACSHLNSSQFGALNTLSYNIELICGPPGTGKSTVIDALVSGDDSSLSLVTAVQNQALEAISIKLAKSKTPFVAFGSRAKESVKQFFLEAQVSARPEVVAVEWSHSVVQRMASGIRSYLFDVRKRIFNSNPDEESFRAQARLTLVEKLVDDPSHCGFDRSLDYRAWSEQFKDQKKREKDGAINDLKDSARRFADSEVNGWKRVADAVLKHIRPRAFAFKLSVVDELRERSTMVSKERENAELDICQNARALLCTVASVGSAMRAHVGNGNAFKKHLVGRINMLVVDEAGTVADRHLLPALLSTPVERLVMVGDTKQLSVFSSLRTDVAESTMARLERTIEPKHLTIQYRMPPALCDVVSKTFYNDTLTTAASKADQQSGIPISLVQVKGTADVREGGTSVSNASEAAEVVHQVQRLKQVLRCEDDDIAVITTYGAQCSEISKRLKSSRLRVRVLTVDSAQGSEFDHVIYSHVASDRGRMGFTKNKNRLCVALSRAKISFTAVAHPKICGVVPALRNLRDSSLKDSATRCFAVAEGGPATTTMLCDMCSNPIGRINGFVSCSGSKTHHLCPACIDMVVFAEAEASDENGVLARGCVWCPCSTGTAGVACDSAPFDSTDIAKHTSKATFDAFNAAIAGFQTKKRREKDKREMEEEITKRSLEIERIALSKNADVIWTQLAEGIVTKEDVLAMFNRRQRTHATGSKLKLVEATKVITDARLKAFDSSGHKAHLNHNDARNSVCGTYDTFLFHGCNSASVANIQSDGLLIKFAKEGMLGAGIYGAPDPRKSFQYTNKHSASHSAGSADFMFVCRFNLEGAQHAGPLTKHRNSLFDEYCIYSDVRCVVLWVLKVQVSSC